jgi:hypothetical protein
MTANSISYIVSFQNKNMYINGNGPLVCLRYFQTSQLQTAII